MAKWNTTRSGSRLIGALVLAMAGSALAQDDRQPDFPLPDEAMLLQELPDGATIEVRLDQDIDGDGIPDTAYVGGTEEDRRLVVKIGYKGELDWGHEVAQVGKLPSYPLGPAELSVKKNVLLVRDLVGGTTATNTVYRYRWDTARKRLQLIGLDAENYSRTNSHDSLKLSWNLLTGVQETVRGIVNRDPKGDDDAAYRYTRPVRTQQKPKPVYIEDTPDPDELLKVGAG